MLEAYFPSDERLAPYVRYIYVQENGDQQFTVFPNMGAAITIYENAQILKMGEGHFSARASTSSGAILHTMRLSPVEISDVGTLRKISIVFHPLGINHFISKPLCDIVAGMDVSMIPCPLKGLTSLLQDLKKTGDPKGKVVAVERWLIENLVPFNAPVLEAAVERLGKDEGELSISRLSRELNVTVRSLNRLFQKHICITPMQYKMICMFRHTLHSKLNGASVDLEAIAIQSGFYDSSHLIRTFQKYAVQKPSLFFKKAQTEVFRQYVFIKK